MFAFGRGVKYYDCRFKWSDEKDAEIAPVDDAETDDEDWVDMMTDACIVADDAGYDFSEDEKGLASLESIGVGKIATWQNVRVPKTAEELLFDARSAEKLIRLGGDPSVGGIRTSDNGFLCGEGEWIIRTAAHGRCYHD